MSKNLENFRLEKTEKSKYIRSKNNEKTKISKTGGEEKFNFVTQGQLWLSRWLQKIISSFSKKI